MKKILCVCIGNSDRSPVMAAILSMFLNKAGHDIVCESAGVGESAVKHEGGAAAPFAVAAAKRIGIDITDHKRRPLSALDPTVFDLVICATDDIAIQVIKAGTPMEKVYNANITNPWPCQFQEDYDGTFQQILSAMYRVIARYFG